VALWPCCREIQEGVPVSDINGNKLGDSKIAAQRGIALVTFSRIGMAAPGMGEYQELPLQYTAFHKMTLLWRGV
jgi:hypothetical protein